MNARTGVIRELIRIVEITEEYVQADVWYG